MQPLFKSSIVVLLLLAASASACAQTGSATIADRAFEPRACRDGTPHKKKLVPVDKGIRLQVLDWGGADMPETMVLLTGLGDNAHMYDQFAFQFTEFFHVIGITRRGFLPSSQPEPRPGASGYDVPTRARDIIAVLDYFGISKAVFVGHSVAGSELSELGLKHRNRVKKLIYLDAYDLSKRFELPEVPGVLTAYTDADARSLDMYLAAGQRLENALRLAPAVCIGLTFDQDGTLVDSTTPPSVPQAILRGVQEPANPPTDWAKIEVPRLGIFSQPSVEGKLPYYWYLDADDRKTFDENWPGIVRWFTRTIREFAADHPGTPTPIVYTLPDAPHYFYVSNNQAFVVRVMRDFLLIPPNAP